MNDVNKLVVTGANGFVGQALLKRGVLEGFSLRAAARRPMINWPSCVKIFQIGNMAEDVNWRSALKGAEAIVHLAARVHVIQDSKEGLLEEFRKVNTLGTERLARMAAAASVKRMIYISSIGVNGKNTNEIPFSESSSPMPHDHYSCSKWEAEQALHKVSQETGLEVVVVRPPLVYGPGNPGNFMRLLKLVDSGIPLPLSLVNNLRSLVYVGNLVDAIIACIRHPAAAGKTYLVSDGEDVSTPDLIRRIAMAMGRKPRLVPVPPSWLRLMGKLTGKSAEIDRLLDTLVIDSSKIRRELDWKPPFTMEEGLRETARWYLDFAKVA